MGRIKHFDRKSEMNRIRVNRYRQKQKIRVFHEHQVREQIYLMSNPEELPVIPSCVANSDENSQSTAYDDRISSFKDKLKCWAVNHRISARAINDLLAILIFVGFTFLPKDSRTFMRTPSNLSIHVLNKGRMWYYGIQKSMMDAFSKLSREISTTLDLNFDGFPVSKSSNSQFWPILAAIRGYNKGIYSLIFCNSC